ncbi:MAG TPA: M24 family metallopeptidase [Actinomycetota bacterium]|nr:M24 family metallopeptidase [Actinomycetota bacterium]
MPIREEGGYPRFSRGEMEARRARLLALAEEHGCAHLVLYGANRAGSAVPWLTGWPVTREALVVVTPGERDVLLVQFRNHVPNARVLAPDAEVRWGGPSTVAAAAAILAERGAARSAVGVVGPLGRAEHEVLASAVGRVVPLDAGYTRLRLVKSPEEIEWTRVGAALTDRAVEALRERAGPGRTERELAAIVEEAYVAAGGTTHIHYLASTPMARPERCAPAQFPSGRTLQPGDALLTEISASFWDYPGQALRTFTVAADPTPLYRDLHDVAQAAFDAVLARVRAGAHAVELAEAASVIGEAGFTTCDDLVHGFVGGYLPPVLEGPSPERAPDMVLEAGMTIVIQPNVITPDRSAGVQTGELVLVTPAGAERLHRLPPGPFRIGDGT